MTPRILMPCLVVALAAAALAGPRDDDPLRDYAHTVAAVDSLMSAGRHAEAAAVAVAALADDHLFQDQRWPLHQRAGLALQALGRHEEALDHLEKAVVWAQTVAVNHRNLATLLVALDRPGRALSEYREACELDPRNWEYRLEYGSVLMVYGQDALAERAFAEAAAICPDCPEVHRAWSRFHLERQDHGAARPHLERLFVLCPGDGEVRSLLALARLRTDAAAEALALLAPAWEGGLGDRDMRIVLEADRLLGNTDRALSLSIGTGDGISRDPDLWAQAALICIDAGLDEQALALVDHALDLDPVNTGYLNNRVLLLRRLGRTREADRAWERLIALDPERAETP
jgi:tetratricopeptide (TPR) repeat protein